MIIRFIIDSNSGQKFNRFIFLFTTYLYPHFYCEWIIHNCPLGLVKGLKLRLTDAPSPSVGNGSCLLFWPLPQLLQDCVLSNWSTRSLFHWKTRGLYRAGTCKNCFLLVVWEFADGVCGLHDAQDEQRRLPFIRLLKLKSFVGESFFADSLWPKEPKPRPLFD